MGLVGVFIMKGKAVIFFTGVWVYYEKWACSLFVLAALFIYLFVNLTSFLRDFQVLCFSVPLLLSFPVTVGVLIGSYSGHNELFDFMGATVKWVKPVPIADFLEHFTIVYWIPVGVAAFLSLIYIAGHIWFPRCVRMARTDK